ncbi:predicted protein [Nematostella vectensis]|uniref:Endonuclease/exonuclease/phosphatase domain-containing protein n=1 Tax=Nematostella vectensis TaxID=45351 RepID=A7TCW5_NEMVE|nr:predicted protein [Nematostella vectensis]|eukprot:XP_001618194.1 hypothetical protein NEMVEDRAFT_v1g225401 [Nematostella vectensis]
MTKGQPLTSQHYWQRKRWPFYRGRRAGMQVKARELYRRHYIDKVRPRPMDREAKRPSSAHNPNNCVQVSTTNSIQKTPISLNAFVPALLLSNVRSLAPKIDEVREAISNANLDLACITETWLRNHIHNNVIAVSGYNLVRRDRTKDQHGGVCIFIKDSIKYQVLEDLMDDEFEVLWIQLRPSRLPRGITSIVVGLVYHPPSAADMPMLEYLHSCLSTMEAS